MSSLMLSVAVETYNQEDTIIQPLDSILQQACDFDFEVVVGDDCSTDNTPKLLDEYARNNPRVRVIHNEKNLGAMKNYYNVVSNCRGKYFMDCAGDDYWLPGKIKTQIDFMEKNEAAGVCCGKAKVFKGEKFVQSIGNKHTSLDDIMNANTIAALTVCIRKALLDEYIAEVEPEKKDWLMEDLPEWLWFSYKSKICFIDEFFGIYRENDSSVSHSLDFEKQLRFGLNGIQIRNFFIEKYGLNYSLKEEALAGFDLCFNRLTNGFKGDYRNRIKTYYTQLKNKSRKYRVRYIIARSYFLMGVYKLVRNLKHKVA